MTYKEKASFNSQTLKVNNFQILFKHTIENKIIHVIALCKEKPLTRHLERSREISTIACLQAIVSPVKDFYKIK